MAWTKQQSRNRVRQAMQQLPSVEIVDLVREADLKSLPLNKAYRIHGAHAYVDIPNIGTLLEDDGERGHKRLLRFLHILQRVAHVVFQATDAIKIDSHNHRLHFVVYKPYDDERKRIAVAVAVAGLLREVVARVNELHEELKDARLRVGVESGMSLAVNNGTRGDREPLFIGVPANAAAKLLEGGKDGVLLGPKARAALGNEWSVTDPKSVPLTQEQLDRCAKSARLDLDADRLVTAWDEERKAIPLADFSFSRPELPLKSLDLEMLTPANSRRFETAVVFADMSGYSAYVEGLRERPTDLATAVRALHVMRKELRDVLDDFSGRKVRYVGDCVQGLVAEGTRSATDAPKTVTTAVLCAGAMRGALDVIHAELPETKELGLGIGIDYGPVSVTRLGTKGSRDRCIVGRAVLTAERAQQRCSGTQTLLSEAGRKVSSVGVRELFPTDQPQADITYNRVEAVIEARDGATRRDLDVVPAAPAIIRPRAHLAGS